jgi:hypothetical protein
MMSEFTFPPSAKSTVLDLTQVGNNWPEHLPQHSVDPLGFAREYPCEFTSNQETSNNE